MSILLVVYIRLCLHVGNSETKQLLFILLGGKLQSFIKGADSAALVLLVCGGPLSNPDARSALEKYIDR